VTPALTIVIAFLLFFIVFRSIPPPILHNPVTLVIHLTSYNNVSRLSLPNSILHDLLMIDG
jgi:hypothetical protein